MQLINEQQTMFILPFEKVWRIVKSEHVVIVLNVILIQQGVQLLQLQEKIRREIKSLDMDLHIAKNSSAQSMTEH